jgi:ABC-type phosphate/phosphonate transport system substrate-binding protein
MYAPPPLRPAVDDFWSGLARAMRAAGLQEVPDRLSWDEDLGALWLSPALLFAQTCGYPLTHALKGRVRPVATPCYGCPDSDGPLYRSLILVRADDPAERLADLAAYRAAANGPDSQSGYSAFRHSIAPYASDGVFFSEVLWSGAHASSIDLVRGGRADVCSVDGVTYHLLARCQPERLAGLRILARSAAAPGLPYITAGNADATTVARLRDALFAAFADPDLAAAREALLLAGIEVLAPGAYDRIVEMEREAEAMGYPVLN